jgi:GNAT superfamily N-acetyltransferase
MRIRPADESDLPVLQDIEVAAGRAFRDIGMAEIAGDEPLEIAELAEYQRSGRAWVAVDAADTPIAYLIADIVDGNTHIEQVSVDPHYGRRGIGRQLIEHVADWSRSIGNPAMTLTTFVDVPWNAPYYARCGFAVVSEPSAGLRRIRQHEAERGLDRWPRVSMYRSLNAE